MILSQNDFVKTPLNPVSRVRRTDVGNSRDHSEASPEHSVTIAAPV